MLSLSFIHITTITCGSKPRSFSRSMQGDPLEQEQWARRLVGYFEERQEFERIVRLVGVGPLLERDAEDNFPLVRRALEVDRSLASFVLEQTRIWRNRLPEKA